MELPNLDQTDKIIGLLIGIGGGLIKIGIQVGRLLTKVEKLEEDLGKISLKYLKTPKSIAEKEEREKVKIKRKKDRDY